MQDCIRESVVDYFFDGVALAAAVGLVQLDAAVVYYNNLVKQCWL